jgi:hypothetical protein
LVAVPEIVICNGARCAVDKDGEATSSVRGILVLSDLGCHCKVSIELQRCTISKIGIHSLIWLRLCEFLNPAIHSRGAGAEICAEVCGWNLAQVQLKLLDRCDVLLEIAREFGNI